MNATVVALGSFHPSLTPFLSHPPAHHARVATGALVFDEVVPAAVGTNTSTALAQALGAEPWAFDTHALDPARFDWAALRAALPHDADATLARLRALAAAGFRFWFLPNG